MNLRHLSKTQAKAKMKADIKLNNIFRRAPNFEESSEIPVDTKEVFDNYYQKHKRKNEFVLHDTSEKVIPEKRRFIEVTSTFVNKSEIESIPTSLDKHNKDVSFLENKNLFQKTRDFESIKMLNKKIYNFPKARPTISNPQEHLERLDEIRKKLEEIPKKTIKKTYQRNKNIQQYRDQEGKLIPLDQNYKHPFTFINCDLRYFNFDFLVDKIGYFDGINLISVNMNNFL